MKSPATHTEGAHTMARDLSALSNAELREAYHSARALQVNASRMNRAAGVFAMERELDACYAEADRRGIALLRPELDPPADRSAGSYLPGERSALELSQAYRSEERRVGKECRS